jgi:sugar/nucleoside kinase (ribokinase family)
MHDADWLSPSERELRGVLGNPDTSLPAIAWTLAERTGARRVVVTMGPEGVVVFDRVADAGSLDGFASRLSSEHIPALTRHAIDPLGCGDAMLTTGVLALAAGADSVGAGYLGSAAAAVQAERIGNHTVSRRSIMERVRRLAEAPPIVQTLSQATMRASG